MFCFKHGLSLVIFLFSTHLFADCRDFIGFHRSAGATLELKEAHFKLSINGIEVEGPFSPSTSIGSPELLKQQHRAFCSKEELFLPYSNPGSGSTEWIKLELSRDEGNQSIYGSIFGYFHDFKQPHAPEILSPPMTEDPIFEEMMSDVSLINTLPHPYEPPFSTCPTAADQPEALPPPSTQDMRREKIIEERKQTDRRKAQNRRKRLKDKEKEGDLDEMAKFERAVENARREEEERAQRIKNRGRKSIHLKSNPLKSTSSPTSFPSHPNPHPPLTLDPLKPFICRNYFCKQKGQDFLIDTVYIAHTKTHSTMYCGYCTVKTSSTHDLSAHMGKCLAKQAEKAEKKKAREAEAARKKAQEEAEEEERQKVWREEAAREEAARKKAAKTEARNRELKQGAQTYFQIIENQILSRKPEEPIFPPKPRARTLRTPEELAEMKQTVQDRAARKQVRKATRAHYVAVTTQAVEKKLKADHPPKPDENL